MKQVEVFINAVQIWNNNTHISIYGYCRQDGENNRVMESRLCAEHNVQVLLTEFVDNLMYFPVYHRQRSQVLFYPFHDIHKDFDEN